MERISNVQRATLVPGLGDGRLASLEELGVESNLIGEDVLRVPRALEVDALRNRHLGLQQRRN
jgi:hypothetical protein